MGLKNKIAVITGASGDIGLAISKQLAKEGVKCYLIDKNTEDFDKIIKKVKNFGWFTAGDFSNPKAVWTIADTLDIELKRIDILINVAGIGIYKPIEKLTFDDINKSININYKAPYILTWGSMPLLKKGKKPVVINIGSGMGVMAEANRSAYCSSKFGLRGLSLSLSAELKGKIDVCLLTLGSVMDHFGTGGIEKRKELKKKGKKYLSLKQVSNKILDIIKAKTREEEYVFYPEGYGQ